MYCTTIFPSYPANCVKPHLPTQNLAERDVITIVVNQTHVPDNHFHPVQYAKNLNTQEARNSVFFTFSPAVSCNGEAVVVAEARDLYAGHGRGLQHRRSRIYKYLWILVNLGTFATRIPILYTLGRPLSRDVLQHIFNTFHRLLD